MTTFVAYNYGCITKYEKNPLEGELGGSVYHIKTSIHWKRSNSEIQNVVEIVFRVDNKYVTK